MTLDRRDAGLAALALALPLLALVASLPQRPLILGVINNFAHAPVFGAFAVIVALLIGRHSRLPAYARYGLAFASAVAAGGVIELVQPSLGRGAEWRDLANDAFGAIAGLALQLAFTIGPTRRRVLAALAACAAAAPVTWPVAEAALAYGARHHRFPTILQDRDWRDRYFVRPSGVEITREALPAEWARGGDMPALRIRITGGRWPGITHAEPHPDWSAYSRILLDLTNAGSRPLALTLRVHDRRHDNRAADRFNRTFELPARQRTVLAIALEEVALAPKGRGLDLSRIAGVILFSTGDPAEIGREYYLTRVWLE
ncbi:MAG TPA: hypothetical protein VFR29_11060 [Steroidobacteraceae bacterium]|nr:hypothetical protein [Steroidobacteraceae bacterium]